MHLNSWLSMQLSLLSCQLIFCKFVILLSRKICSIFFSPLKGHTYILIKIAEVAITINSHKAYFNTFTTMAMFRYNRTLAEQCKISIKRVIFFFLLSVKTHVPRSKNNNCGYSSWLSCFGSITVGISQWDAP